MTLVEQLYQWLTDQQVSEPFARYLSWVIPAVGVIVLAFILYLLTMRILVTGLSFLIRRTKTTWDDYLVRHRVFARVAHLAPALVLYYGAELFGPAESYIQRLATVYMVIAGATTLQAFLNAFTDIYQTFEIARHRPIKGYIQVLIIVIYILVGLISLSVIMGQKPWLLLSGLGAMTAVILLIFKDTILGLVASVQLSMNDMVRIGDWIEMPKYGADGDVIDITLHTVKVQNWDKTITTIPAYAMISDAFKNWRGMKESGGRRIKRSLFIDMTTITFCDDEMLDRFEKFERLRPYLKERREEIKKYNEEHNVDLSELINGRRLTNIGCFRAYLVAYLRNHPKVHQSLTFLVRHLEPTERGLPIQVYVFCTDQVWANYESIQADIFDHILAVVPLFDLRVFQSPSGYDIREFSQIAQEN